MAKSPERRVFLSYARKDGAELAQRLEGDLRSAGFEVRLDTARLQGGSSWTVEIERAIDRCDVMVAVLTRRSYISDICRAEQLRALGKRRLVIPVKGQPKPDIPLHLETRNYRDFSSRYAPAFKLLAADIRG